MDVIKSQIHLARQSLERFGSKILIEYKDFSKPGTLYVITLSFASLGQTCAPHNILLEPVCNKSYIIYINRNHQEGLPCLWRWDTHTESFPSAHIAAVFQGHAPTPDTTSVLFLQQWLQQSSIGTATAARESI
jgi:hypothetical protein